MRRPLLLVALPLACLGLSACGDPSAEIQTGPSARLSIECEDESWTAVGIKYGFADRVVAIIGRDFPEMDWFESWDQSYGLSETDESAVLTVEVSPGDGTCLVRIVDEESGEVLGRETGRRDFTLTAHVTR